MLDFKKIREQITNHQVSQSNTKKFGEVHTPFSLIDEMLDTLPKEVWFDPSKTWLDPAAGIGNYMIVVVERLMEGLKSSYPDPIDRYRHIIGNMIYQVELQPESCKIIEQTFNPDGTFKLNLHCGSFLESLPWDEEVNKFFTFV
jgi:type I restriction-modification system DNA methylase subunit